MTVENDRVDKREASEVAEAALADLRALSYDQLVARFLDEDRESVSVMQEVVGPSGTRYQVVLEGWYDDASHGPVRISAAVDDGGFWAAMKPLCRDFIRAPDGYVIGE
jgi:hypothetical protein